MTAKITVPPISRSIPTPIQYQVERIESTSYEFTDEGMDNNDRANRIEAYRILQTAELDALDDRVRACYGMQPRRYGYRGPEVEQPGGDFTTADKVQPTARSMPVPPIADAPRPGSSGTITAREMAPRTTPPPNAMRDVLDGTVDELRRLGARLAALGHPYDGDLPSSEAEAQALIPKLRGRIFDLEKQPGAPAARPAPVAQPIGGGVASPAGAPLVTPDGKAFRAGATVAAGERRCSDAAHGVRNPQPISSLDWDTSHRIHGVPLCQAHMRARREAAVKPGAK